MDAPRRDPVADAWLWGWASVVFAAPEDHGQGARARRKGDGAETWDALRSRRNVREFSPTPVSEEDMAKILEAGRLAPSARNWQPWDFVLVTDRDQLRDITGVWQGAWHVGGAAAAIAIVAPNLPTIAGPSLLQYDLGHATMLMMLAAADLGIGTCHSSVQDQELARKILGFPQSHFLAYLVSLGYPADGPLRPLTRLNRRPFDEVVHRGRW